MGDPVTLAPVTLAPVTLAKELLARLVAFDTTSSNWNSR